MEGLKVTIYLAGLIFHGSHSVDLYKHHYTAGSGIGWRRLHFWFHLCAQTWPCPLCRLSLVCTSPWFHPTALAFSASACWLPQTSHGAFVLLEKPNTRWSKSLCNSNIKATIKPCLCLLWWLLNYALILMGVQWRAPSDSWHKCLPFRKWRKEAASVASLRGFKNKSNCDWFNSFNEYNLCFFFFFKESTFSKAHH